MKGKKKATTIGSVQCLQSCGDGASKKQPGIKGKRDKEVNDLWNRIQFLPSLWTSFFHDIISVQILFN